MTIKDTFPLFFFHYHTQHQAFWQGPLTGDQLDNFIEFAEEIFYKNSVFGTDAFHSCVKYLLEDILSSKTKSTNEELEVLHFLQFYISVRSASFLCHHGLFTQAHDWLVWSISDNIDYDTEVSFQLERLDIFFRLKIPFIGNNKIYIYIEWMTTLFYYSAHQGGLKELAS